MAKLSSTLTAQGRTQLPPSGTKLLLHRRRKVALKQRRWWSMVLKLYRDNVEHYVFYLIPLEYSRVSSVERKHFKHLILNCSLLHWPLWLLLRSVVIRSWGKQNIRNTSLYDVVKQGTDIIQDVLHVISRYLCGWTNGL